MTWRDILAKLQTFSEEQLAQPAQSLPPLHDNDSEGLYKIISLNSVDYWSKDEDENLLIQFRSVNDNQFHPEHFALLSDGAPTSKDGDTFYTLQDDNTFKGNVSGKIIPSPFHED